MKKAAKTEKRGPGRPAIAAENRRVRYLAIPLNEAELAEIQRAAAAAGSLTATWCRETLMRAAKRGKT